MSTIDLYRLVSVGLLSFILVGQSKLDFWQKLNIYPRKLLCFVNVHNAMPGLQNVRKFEF